MLCHECEISGLYEHASRFRECGCGHSQHGLGDSANCCTGVFHDSRSGNNCLLRAGCNELGSTGIEIQHDCFDAAATLFIQRVTGDNQLIEHQLIRIGCQHDAKRLCFGNYPKRSIGLLHILPTKGDCEDPGPTMIINSPRATARVPAPLHTTPALTMIINRYCF